MMRSVGKETPQSLYSLELMLAIFPSELSSGWHVVTEAIFSLFIDWDPYYGGLLKRGSLCVDSSIEFNLLHRNSSSFRFLCQKLNPDDTQEYHQFFK